MKENKFRGKRLDNGFWFYGYYVFCRKRHYILPYIEEKIGFDERYQEWIEVDPATVGQYTGLKDSNRTEEYPEGQEICEGDIVQYHPEANMGTGPVVYELGAFRVQGDFDALLYHFSLKALEVIGNIHDNPELLT